MITGAYVALVGGQYRLAFQTPTGTVSVNLGGREAALSFWRQMETALFEISPAETSPSASKGNQE